MALVVLGLHSIFYYHTYNSMFLLFTLSLAPVAVAVLLLADQVFEKIAQFVRRYLDTLVPEKA